MTFIYPCIGRDAGKPYVRSWQMQPLAIAVLSALTPSQWDRRFYDDRLEPIDYGAPTDLVAISVETYTARRSYQIAAKFRARGVPVVLGGYHPTLCPDDAARHADAICVGEAEDVWPDILADAARRTLKKIYRAPRPAPLKGVMPDRTIFGGKKYLKIGLIEAGRGCPYACTFCSICAFHRGASRYRPVADVVAEVQAMRATCNLFFFVDDNFVGDRAQAKAMLEALRPLGITWTGQASLTLAGDPEMLELLKASGCAGLLIGFESLAPANIEAMHKQINVAGNYAAALGRIRNAGLLVYGTFMFGFPHDTAELYRRTVAFAVRNKLFLSAFNHVVPFPGTPLYEQLEREGRLLKPRWWLDERYRFGSVVYDPGFMRPEELEDAAHAARAAFYRIGSVLRRALDFRANCRTLLTATRFLAFNWLMRRELKQKFGLPLGIDGEGEVA